MTLYLDNGVVFLYFGRNLRKLCLLTGGKLALTNNFYLTHLNCIHMKIIDNYWKMVYILSIDLLLTSYDLLFTSYDCIIA